jgi:uncharacterized protein (TIGR02246 family)
VTQGIGTTTRVAMVHTMCEQVDTGDAAGFARWFAEDASYVFGNGPALEGRAAVEEATAQAAGSIRGLRHHVDQVAEVGDQLFCRFTIHGVAADDRPVALPCVTVIWLGEDGAILDYRVHMDATPFSPA